MDDSKYSTQVVYAVRIRMRPATCDEPDGLDSIWLSKKKAERYVNDRMKQEEDAYLWVEEWRPSI